MATDNRKAVLEALLFASSKPLTLDSMADASGLEKPALKKILAALQEEYSSDARGFNLEEVAGGYQLRSDPRFATQIGRLFAAKSRRRMTRSSLESLAIIAYRQPVTRAEVEHIRGVDSGAVIKNLLSLAMVRVLGRKEGPGRPILYGTTREFLEYFGLRDIESLPTLEEITELLEEGEEGSALEGEKRGKGEEGIDNNLSDPGDLSDQNIGHSSEDDASDHSEDDDSDLAGN